MTDDATELESVGVVTVFLRHDAEVLLVRRSDAVGPDPGRWGGVAGHAEGDPDAAARREIREVTGRDPDALSFVRAGDPFVVDDADRGTRWRVHPHLFDAPDRSVDADCETSECAWVPPTEIRRRETVPDLWASYDRVRPRVATVATDRDHGSTALSVRALEVLRDEAALAAAGVDPAGDERTGNDWADLAALARDLRDARPSMVVIENRIDRAMAAALDDPSGDGGEDADGDDADPHPAAVERAATGTIERALTADGEAAGRAARHLGSRVGTLSRSGTVLAALERADPDAVVVAESRPGREGVATAEAVAERTGADVTLTTDAAFVGRLAAAGVEALAVGADAVLADGRVVNKVGTRAAVTAARREGIDCYAVAASDKITHRETFDPEERDAAEVYDCPDGAGFPDADADASGHGGADGDPDGHADADDGPDAARIAVANPTFEATPADRFDAVLTETGALDRAGIREVAASHRERADWG